ncbi:MAG: hypothetical protein H7A53_12345 [Akkermansiaceae bacterium]|nr:hypothetical protein [Akkermansiaceae bacterium]MCP5551670.1 hypothetical protein [Akkermansiaceae bacterium]
MSSPSRNRRRPARSPWFLLGAVAGAGVAAVCSMFFFPSKPKKVPAVSDRIYTTPAEWDAYKRTCLSPEGRVMDTANGNITHSEGIGYGMLLAVHFNDRPAFEAMWTWAAKKLRVRADSLFAWSWKPAPGSIDGEGAVPDTNNASDGDILIAWALLRAAARWPEAGNHRSEALRILSDLRAACVRRSAIGPVLLPGSQGFVRENGDLVLNPSYWVWPAFEAFAAADLEPETWLDLSASGLRLVRAGRFGSKRLPGDWVVLRADNRIELPAPGDFNTEFGYNAVRVPLYLSWAGFGQEDLLRPFADFPENCRVSDGSPAATWNLAGDSPGGDPAMAGAHAIFEMSRSAVNGEPPRRERLPVLAAGEAYYSASLLLLTKVALTERAAADAVVTR